MRPFAAAAWRSAIVAGAIGLALAVAADRWYAGEMRTVERERVQVRMAPYAHGLRNVVDRRIGILRGFHSFVSTRRTRAAFDAQFQVFARGAIASATGVRALQVYADGRISAIEPLEPNRSALGLDLLNDPRPNVRADHLRILASRGPVVSGPIRLIEGGTGLLLRQRLTDRPGFPQVVAVLLDVPSILKDAGIPDTASGLKLEVSSADGRWSDGESIDSSEAPVRVRVAFQGTSWVLSAVPRPGWGAGSGAARWSFRGVLAAFVLLIVLVALELGDRLDRLARARAESDSTLAVAMRAGRLSVWSLDLASGALEVSGAVAGALGDGPPRPDDVRRLLDRTPLEDRRTLLGLFDEAKDGRRESLATEFRLLRADGAVRTLLCVGQVVDDAAGRPQQLVGILSDITERRAMETRLQQAARFESVGRLAGGVAHDFNNLLTAIGGFAELAADRARHATGAGARAVNAHLEQLRERTRAGTQLTTQLLNFSRRAPAEASRVEIGAALAELEPVLARLFTGPMSLEVATQPSLPAVRVVSTQLTQVILSLLVRARDAADGPDRVTVRAVHVPATSGPRPLDAPVGEWVCVEVIEEGARGAAGARASRPTTPGGRPLAGDAEGWGIELAVLASGIESWGGRLVGGIVEEERSLTRLFLPLWDRPD